ncbi:MAG: hypothetical protein LCI02_24385 [Proteobacteria bacterium]|nr:hypothetical protein [Pseudomonadota bacterium]
MPAIVPGTSRTMGVFGERVSLHASALGKALLGLLPREQALRAVCAGLLDEAPTPS